MVECPNCEGYGSVVSERSIRHGHTHGNDPNREDETCDLCEGKGEIECES